MEFDRFTGMQKKGQIKSWNEQKGFGFLRPSGNEKDVFVHVSALGNRHRTPTVGQIVTYSLSTDNQGRVCAANVLLPGDRSPARKAKTGIRGVFFVPSIFLCLIAFLVYFNNLPMLILWGYVIISLVTFLVYASDKSAAKGGSWRISENKLHWLSLLGGWPGAYVAQQTLRHKSKKQSFRSIFWVTVVINCGALLWLSTPEGAQFLQGSFAEGFTMKHSATIEWAE